MSYWIYIIAGVNDKFVKQIVNQYKKTTPNVDPDIVKLYLQRWDQYKQKLKPINDYKTFKDLEEAVKDLRTTKERELELKTIDTSKTTTVYKDGVWTAVSTADPVTLSKLAQGSAWCVRNPSTAEDYLRRLKKFTIVQKNGYPFAAIAGKNGGVWYKTDSDFESDTSYGIKDIHIFEDDYEKLQEIMEEIGRPLDPQEDKIRTHSAGDGKAYVERLIKRYATNWTKTDKVQSMLAISGLTDGVGEIKELEAKFSDEGFEWLAYAQLVTHKANKKANEYASNNLNDDTCVEYIKTFNPLTKSQLKDGILNLLRDEQAISAIKLIKEFNLNKEDFKEALSEYIKSMIFRGEFIHANAIIRNAEFTKSDFKDDVEESFAEIINTKNRYRVNDISFAIEAWGINPDKYRKKAIPFVDHLLDIAEYSSIEYAKDLITDFRIYADELDQKTLRAAVYSSLYSDYYGARGLIKKLGMNFSDFRDEATTVVRRKLESGISFSKMNDIEKLVYDFDVDMSLFRPQAIDALKSVINNDNISHDSCITFAKNFKLSEHDIESVAYINLERTHFLLSAIGMKVNEPLLIKKLQEEINEGSPSYAVRIARENGIDWKKLDFTEYIKKLIADGEIHSAISNIKILNLDPKDFTEGINKLIANGKVNGAINAIKDFNLDPKDFEFTEGINKAIADGNVSIAINAIKGLNLDLKDFDFTESINTAIAEGNINKALYCIIKLNLDPRDFGLDEHGEKIKPEKEKPTEPQKPKKETPKEPEEKPKEKSQEPQDPVNPVKQQDKAESNKEKLFSSWICVK